MSSMSQLFHRNCPSMPQHIGFGILLHSLLSSQTKCMPCMSTAGAGLLLEHLEQVTPELLVSWPQIHRKNPRGYPLCLWAEVLSHARAQDCQFEGPESIDLLFWEWWCQTSLINVYPSIRRIHLLDHLTGFFLSFGSFGKHWKLWPVWGPMVGKELMKQIGKHFPDAQRIKCAHLPSGWWGEEKRATGTWWKLLKTDKTASTIYTVLRIFVAGIDTQQDVFFVSCVLWLCFCSRPPGPWSLG